MTQYAGYSPELQMLIDALYPQGAPAGSIAAQVAGYIPPNGGTPRAPAVGAPVKAPLTPQATPAVGAPVVAPLPAGSGGGAPGAPAATAAAPAKPTIKVTGGPGSPGMSGYQMGQLGLGGLQAIGNLYLGYLGLQNANRQFDFMSGLANRNLANQANTLNTAREDRLRGRVSANYYADNKDAVDREIKKKSKIADGSAI